MARRATARGDAGLAALADAVRALAADPDTPQELRSVLLRLVDEHTPPPAAQQHEEEQAAEPSMDELECQFDELIGIATSLMQPDILDNMPEDLRECLVALLQESFDSSSLAAAEAQIAALEGAVAAVCDSDAAELLPDDVIRRMEHLAGARDAAAAEAGSAVSREGAAPAEALAAAVAALLRALCAAGAERGVQE
eukprot:gene36113-8484_t